MKADESEKMDVKDCVELLERQAVLDLRDVVPVYLISQ
jgi:hypothetical protein